MSIKVRLIIMNFLQFFVWGSWLISLGGYMGRELHFEGGQIGAIFATMGIASLVMPGIIGIIADKWFNAERLYGLCHIAGAGCLFYASTATGYDQMYWAMLLNLLVYMPTLSLANTVSYNALEQYKCDLIKDFPPIRVWGTIGFICAMWAVDLTGFKNSSAQLYVGGASALLLGLYSFTLPACRPAKSENKSWLSAFGLDALVLFKKKKMAIFFLFSMLLGAALQITNTYGDLFLSSFASIPEYAESFGVKHSVILLSISQMSETLFILAIENTMITHSPQVTEKLKSFDIPSIIEYSSYEEEPLGRVEWVKFFGALTDRDEKADELFNEQVDIVNRIAKTDGTDTDDATKSDTVAFFYITSNGQVQVRKSTDYVPKMISLAGGKYIFDASNDDDTGRSTMNMQLEDFYNGAIDADYLIYNSAIDGGVKNLNELLDKCPVLADFRAVKDGNVFCTTNDMYQQSMSIGYMIDDMHSMITGAADSDMKYLFKLK